MYSNWGLIHSNEQKSAKIENKSVASENERTGA